jgi:molybdenum cofactor guanylyltransferase
VDNPSNMMPEGPERRCFAGAVLLGGRSRRMGTDKAQLEIDGVPLLRRQCATLREAGVSELFLSTRPDLPVAIPDARTVLDANEDIGPIAGIAAVLDAASCPLVFMLAVDMPAITVAMIQHMLSSSRKDHGCVPIVHGRQEPLAAVYPRSLLPMVHSQIAVGRYALQDLLEMAIAANQMNSLEIADINAGQFMNCNHPGDWQEFLDRQER